MNANPRRTAVEHTARIVNGVLTVTRVSMLEDSTGEPLGTTTLVQHFDAATGDVLPKGTP